MKYIVVLTDLLIKMLEVDDFIYSDFGARFLFIQVLSKSVVPIMKLVEWKEICDGYMLIEVGSGQCKDDVLSNLGARSHYQKTH